MATWGSFALAVGPSFHLTASPQGLPPWSAWGARSPGTSGAVFGVLRAHHTQEEGGAPVVWIGSQSLTCPLNKYLLFGKNICSKAPSYQQDWGVLKPQSSPETSRSEALSAQTLGCD